MRGLLPGVSCAHAVHLQDSKWDSWWDGPGRRARRGNGNLISAPRAGLWVLKEGKSCPAVT